MFKIKKERKDGGLKNNLKCNKFCPEHPSKPSWCRGMCKNCYDKWLKKNNPQFLENQHKNHKKWVQAHREQARITYRKWVVKRDPLYNRIKGLRKYGMTISDYDAMLKIQNGGCFICQKPPKEGKNLHVDHDHNTGLIRGLLCFRCNFGLSYFEENKDNIERLYKYICKYK